MRRKWCIWLILLMCIVSIPSLAMADNMYANEADVLEYRGPCPHELCSYGRVLPKARGSTDFMTEEADYVTAGCIYCNRIYNVKVAGGSIQGSPKDAEACTHHFCKLDDVLEQGWYPAGNAVSSASHAPLHEYRTYYICQCSYCDSTIRMYEGQIVNGIIPERHSYAAIEETLVHAHVPGENLHVYMRTCQVCGYYEAVLEGCGQLENGLCTVKLKALLREQGCENHSREERETCPRCR